MQNLLPRYMGYTYNQKVPPTKFQPSFKLIGVLAVTTLFLFLRYMVLDLKQRNGDTQNLMTHKRRRTWSFKRNMQSLSWLRKNRLSGGKRKSLNFLLLHHQRLSVKLLQEGGVEVRHQKFLWKVVVLCVGSLPLCLSCPSCWNLNVI